MKKLFIGIDFSKEKIDVSLFEGENPGTIVHHIFANTPSGGDELLQWLHSCSRTPSSEWLFCGEHTGLYSSCLSGFFVAKGLFMWLENPSQIKKSMGIQRSKTDKIDSRAIALYAWRFQDRAALYKIPDTTINSLRLLFSYRERLIRMKTALRSAAKESYRINDRDEAAYFVYEDTQEELNSLCVRIKRIEQKMEQVISKQEQVEENYALICSVKGIGKVNAIAIMVATDNFTRFESGRKFACYCGVVPFERSSGSSIRGGRHISRVANVKIKTYLTQAARSAVLYARELREYYQRKKMEGKMDKVIINNVRNKLIQRMFAVVQKKKVFDPQYKDHLGLTA